MSEDGRADTHRRRAKADGGFIIARHAHGEFFNASLRGKLVQNVSPSSWIVSARVEVILSLLQCDCHNQLPCFRSSVAGQIIAHDNSLSCNVGT